MTSLPRLQTDASPDYKRSAGNKLWRFYTEYLKVRPHIAAETEDVLKHLVQALLQEGYSGVLFVLDEVSLFMKNRDDSQRTDDEQTLVVLSNRLARVHNLPVWTVCAAQQALESKMGVKNIIADDRLKQVELLKDDQDYYDIVLSRVREISRPDAIGSYYLYYKRGFSWPDSIGQQEFSHFFPFHKPALEVLRAITYELTTTRSAIHFMHQTLKHQIKARGHELIRLWELFDETVRYEEDPSGVHAGLVAIKTKRESEYKIYEACKRQIDSLTKGMLKVHRDKAVKILQTLFLYHLAKTRQKGITAEELANAVLIERAPDATVEENIQHYENLGEHLKRELPQIASHTGEDNQPRYQFEPVAIGPDPRREFQRARDEAESNPAMTQAAWKALLGLDEWLVRTRQMTIDLASHGGQSLFRRVAPRDDGQRDLTLDLLWKGRQIFGAVGMRDFHDLAVRRLPLPALETDQSDLDFGVFISTRHASDTEIHALLSQRQDPRVILWTPDELSYEERERLFNFAAYRKLIAEHGGKESEEATTIVKWVADMLQTELGQIAKIVDSSYARGRMDSLENTRLPFHAAGELPAILTPVVDRVLADTYESSGVTFEPPVIFRKEEGVKVINGLVKTGRIPKGVKPDQNISAARNFGFGLGILKRGPDEVLDVADNPYVNALWNFIDDKLSDDGQVMKIETLYKNFMGIGGPKDYGLTRRMAQIYLLCLVREGKIRVGLSPKAGVSVAMLDYTSLPDIDFSARILDSLTDVQKMVKPEHWDALRPYLEIMLDERIPDALDDAGIKHWRDRLKTLFAAEGEEVEALRANVRSLFEALGAENPYPTPLEQIGSLFLTDLAHGDDLEMLLHGLRDALHYCARENGISQGELDDLKSQLREYRLLKNILNYENELRTAAAYCACELPDTPELQDIRSTQKKLAKKLRRLEPFLESEVKLKTELIGKQPPQPDETGTLGRLIHAYTQSYLALHQTVSDRVDAGRKRIQVLLASDELHALHILSGIRMLQQRGATGADGGQISSAAALEQRLRALQEKLFTCPSASRQSIEDALRRRPFHECDLSWQTAPAHQQQAADAAAQAEEVFRAALDSTVTVFLNPKIRERLEQGRDDPLIAGLLACEDPESLQSYVVQTACSQQEFVDSINRYLKRIVVKTLKLSDFKPSMRTLEADQIPKIAEEFQQYLETHLREIAADDDTLPILQVE